MEQQNKSPVETWHSQASFSESELYVAQIFVETAEKEGVEIARAVLDCETARTKFEEARAKLRALRQAQSTISTTSS